MSTLIEIETWSVPGKFQLKLRKGWDDAIYIEVGRDWKPTKGFGHPILGRLKWEISDDNRLSQRLPQHVVCHYPITVSAEIADTLRKSNAA